MMMMRMVVTRIRIMRLEEHLLPSAKVIFCHNGDEDDIVDMDDDVGLATSQASRISGLCLL